jgi:diguanylate cyclase (GGDEF)-like protein
VIPQALRDGRCDNIEYQMRTRDGRVLDVLLSAVWIYEPDGRPLHSLAVVQDVTEKKHLLARSHYAEHDPLTGLPNRVLLQDRLERSCAQHQRHGTRFAVGFLDLDHFKQINDTLGHEAGDLLLKEVAQRLAGTLRASDTVCRLAGDEFVLLFDDVGANGELQALTRKVLDQVAQPCRLGPGPQAPLVDVSASMGVAIFPEHGEDPETLLAHADQAMYAAKRAGRSQVGFYRPRA